MTLKTTIPLPVKVYEKCNDIMFTVEINKNIMTITPYQSPHNKNTVTMLQHIVLCHMNYGVNLIPILFPLTFMIIKNELVCDMFYLFKTLSGNTKTDFIYNLITSVNNIFGHTYTLYTDMNIVNLINVLQLHNNDNTDEIIENTLNKMFYRINRYINFCIAIMSQAHININQGSKIILIINIIKQTKVLFYGNHMSVDEHMEHILNPGLLKKKRVYFYEKDGKILKMQYNELYKDYLSAYPSRYSKNITITTLIDTLITSNYRLLHNITANVLYKKKPDMITLLEQYIFDNNVDVLYNLCVALTQSPNDINIYIKISYNKFVKIISTNNKYDENILNILLSNYTFPISYDKRELNDTFAKLLYYCFTFHNTINFVTINSKAKQLLIMLVRFYVSLKDNKIDVIYNSKYYTDTLLYTVIKILIFNDTYKLLNVCDSPHSKNANAFFDVGHQFCKVHTKTEFSCADLHICDSHILETIKNKFTENMIVIQILNNISWKTLNKQIDYFKYLVSMKDLCKDLILMDGKLNKQYIMCMDTRLRKVIMEPLQMLNYLKTENDYYKWLYEFRNLIGNIFNNIIILEDDDYMRLSKILYIYSKIKNQSMEDKYYRKLINYIKENNRLILFNDRINIKLKDLFKNELLFEPSELIQELDNKVRQFKLDFK
jgi:hypothetical protein